MRCAHHLNMFPIQSLLNIKCRSSIVFLRSILLRNAGHDNDGRATPPTNHG